VTLKSKKLAEQIARLDAERRAAVDAEREADERELIRLVTQAHCLADALGYARSKLNKRKAGGQQKTHSSEEMQ